MSPLREARGEPLQPEPSPFESGLGFMLGCAHRALRAGWEEALAELGLTAPQAVLVRAVAERSGVGLRELARRMRTDAMNVKRLADHLEGAGLVRSAEDPAHRQRRLLCVTDEGRRTAAEVALLAAAWERRLGERIGRERLARLRSLLQDLDAALTSESGRPAAGRARS